MTSTAMCEPVCVCVSAEWQRGQTIMTVQVTAHYKGQTPVMLAC